MNTTNQNPIRHAANKIGGVTITSNLLGVSNGCVYNWIKQGRVNNIHMARKLAELAAMPVELVRPIED
jgi:hypothetical protein